MPPTDDMSRIELLTAAHRHRGGALLDAIAAACALVAHADTGECASERRGILDVQLSDPLLAALPADELSSRLAAHAAAWRALAPMRAEPGQARLVLEACARMAPADGRVEAREIDAVRLVRSALGLAP